MALPRTRFSAVRRLRADLWGHLVTPSLRSLPLLVGALGPKLPRRLRELRPPRQPPRGRRRSTPSLAKRQLLAWVRLRQYYRLPRSGPLRTLRRSVRCRAAPQRRLLTALEGRAAALLVRAGFLLPTAARQQLSHRRVAVGGRPTTRPGHRLAAGQLLSARLTPRPGPRGPSRHLEVSLAAAAALVVRPPRQPELTYPFKPSIGEVLSHP